MRPWHTCHRLGKRFQKSFQEATDGSFSTLTHLTHLETGTLTEMDGSSHTTDHIFELLCDVIIFLERKCSPLTGTYGKYENSAFKKMPT